jgi:hypothetical protein
MSVGTMYIAAVRARNWIVRRARRRVRGVVGREVVVVVDIVEL